jgi:hypothetical protein
MMRRFVNHRNENGKGIKCEISNEESTSIGYGYECKSLGSMEKHPKLCNVDNE